MPTPTHSQSSIPEQLLSLAGDFTRFTDSLSALTVSVADSNAALHRQIEEAQQLADAASTLSNRMAGLRLYRSTRYIAAMARIRQLGQLALDAVDHLYALDQVLDHARNKTPRPDGEPPLSELAALSSASGRLRLARDLTALGGLDAARAAEAAAQELHRQQHGPVPAAVQLSERQQDLLHAVGEGTVTYFQAGPAAVARYAGEPVSLNNLRALEARGFLVREPSQRVPVAQRCYLTATGRAALAATFVPSRPAPEMAPRVSPRPAMSRATGR
ncbi:hypothetical protein ACIBUY_04410 [Streptomyces sp. NPDC050085]|uniref:hypothetical protein n=1 Tax=Streptomyces sp. NPDC050085 TaxID=3365600 RepID=UPI003789571D